MSKYLCADCVLREQCDCEWTMRCARYVPKEYKQTNEEFIRSCTTEDMAKIIAQKLLELARNEYGLCDVVDYKTVLGWLKEKHES